MQSHVWPGKPLPTRVSSVSRTRGPWIRTKYTVFPKFCYTLIFLFQSLQNYDLYEYENKWAFHTFIMIITIILFNVTSSSSNDTAQTRSETLANFADEIFSHRGPWTINGWFQLLYTAVANFTGLAFNMRPDAVVEGVQVRRLWRPEVLGPKVHVWPQPLLNNVCGVCRRTILLEYVVCISSYFSHPR